MIPKILISATHTKSKNLTLKRSHQYSGQGTNSAIKLVVSWYIGKIKNVLLNMSSSRNRWNCSILQPSHVVVAKLFLALSFFQENSPSWHISKQFHSDVTDLVLLICYIYSRRVNGQWPIDIWYVTSFSPTRCFSFLLNFWFSCWVYKEHTRSITNRYT